MDSGERHVKTAFDPHLVRRDFPILSTEQNGWPLVFLDSAASAQKPTVVIDSMAQFMLTKYANVHRGLYRIANVATEEYEHVRDIVCKFLNASRREEIVFTKSVTEAINLVASSLGHSLSAGDEIVLSVMEHHSNIVPWYFLKERKGVVIKWAPVDDHGTFLFDEFVELLTPRTKVVAITHMSNVLGTVPPIKDIVRVSHEVGALVFVDGAQGAVHGPVDVQDLDADFYGITGHKLYAPTGVGVLYGKFHLLGEMPPFLGGGEMIANVSTDKITYSDPPYKFEAGTPPIVEVVGLGAAISYLDSFSIKEIREHELDVSGYAHDRLGEIADLRIYGEAKDKGPIISFNLDNVSAHDMATILDGYGIAVRAGMHCAQPVLERFGIKASCRASFGLYNTRDDVDRLFDGIKKAVSLLS